MMRDEAKHRIDAALNTPTRALREIRMLNSEAKKVRAKALQDAFAAVGAVASINPISMENVDHDLAIEMAQDAIAALAGFGENG